ncbi:penicillin-binding protein 2 [Candidatus Dependentiae bacterium]|nr:penicillin-binding protein 2 [Candidatus Dependentiae bacterium]
MNSHSNSRLIIVFFFFFILYMLVLFNLYLIQITRAPFFKALAQQQYAMTLTSTPPRAEIFDRTGTQPLALNKDSISAFITPSKLENEEGITLFLKKQFPQAFERLKKNKRSHFMYIKRRLSPQELEIIKLSAQPDIKLLKEPGRFYTLTSMGPIIGITDIDNKGLFGIEGIYNTRLAGNPTTYLLEKDARFGNFYFKRETKVEGTQGSPVTLTIDGVLQFLAYEELKDYVKQIGSKNGSILILDPKDGDVLVMANYPDFDPNNTDSLDQSFTKNRIITDSYELGSVIKAFLALAALEEKVVSPTELIDCENRLTTFVQGIRVNTTRSNGLIPFTEVLQYSNNIGVAKVAHRIGTPLYTHYRNLGFGKKTGIFPGENPGFITPPSQWSKASLNSLSFGYEIRATVLQLGQAACMIANADGFLIRPRLVKTDAPAYKEGPFFTPEALQKIRQILITTIDKGAAQKARISGYTVLGKTGTARLITNGKYDPTRHIFTFMGIIEKGSYKRVVIVFLKETAKKGLLASAIAAPLFERVAHKMLIHDKII